MASRTDCSDSGCSILPGTLRLLHATDTDGDGLSDGQELVVRAFKTDQRYPMPDGTSSGGGSINMTTLGAPVWSIRSVDLMVGFTHADMAQVAGALYHFSPWQTFPYFTIDRLYGFRTSGSNPGQANNFTSYDLLQKPATPGDSWFVPSDFVILSPSSIGWSVFGGDNAADGKKGQLEYGRLQFAVHTLPNRADTDGDGLNDSEELKLGSDGFATDPWKLDMDGDTLTDNEYATKGTDLGPNASRGVLSPATNSIPGSLRTGPRVHLLVRRGRRRGAPPKVYAAAR